MSGSGWGSALALAACLALPVAALWGVEGFVTQDGPAHLYNAHVLARSLGPDSPFSGWFAVRWEPLPNWAGHVLLAGLTAALPARVADRAMTTLTLVGLAAGSLWLRGRVAGCRGLARGAPLAALLGLNVTWLFGFTGFLLGAALFPLTLGYWWRGRDSGWSGRRAWGLGGLVVLGYFCHLVSLGLTAFGLLVLEAGAPGERRRGRAWTTLAGLSPLVPLGGVYLRLMRRGGGVAPEWKHLASPFSPRAWVTQLAWVDPVSLARKDHVPLLGGAAPWHSLLAPAAWLGLGLLVYVMIAARDRETRAWWWLGGCLLLGGVAGPDTLGAAHGEYLQQRVVLLGLVALVPVLPLTADGWAGRLGAGLVAGALLLQTALVWDYAATSDRTAGAVLRAGGAVGRGQRLAGLFVAIRTPFRANPLLHSDCALGVGTGNIVWGNYEARFYYFPVQFRPGLDRPDPFDLERVALCEDPAERLRLWSALLDRHGRSLDVVVVGGWGRDPALDAYNARRFRVEGTGLVRVLRPKGG